MSYFPMMHFPKWKFVSRFVRPPYQGIKRRQGIEGKKYNYIEICYRDGYA